MNNKLLVVTFSGALFIAVPLYAQTSGGSGSMGTGHRGDSMDTGAPSGGTAGTSSGTADRTPTPGSMSGGLMQGSGVNTNSGTGSNATGTTGATDAGRTGTGSSSGMSGDTGR
jgi:hypothetical protein